VNRSDRLAGGIWIQGAGELASGVAVRLWRRGYRVVMAEEAAPRAVRRLVAFAEAVYAGRHDVEEVPGVRVDRADAVGFAAGPVVVVVDPAGTQLRRLCPDVVVDARMTKRPPLPLPEGPWPVIGLGPGFRCGREARFVVETQRGPQLGALLAAGEAAPNSGAPGLIGGEDRRRLLRAPAAGRCVSRHRIGDLVTAGECVGEIDGVPVVSRLDGRLRGLIHPDVELSVGEKVGDVDPRGLDVDPARISDKALAVGGGVLMALARLGIEPAAAGLTD
jgi:xanthine dehydrogenase accessory factor